MIQDKTKKRFLPYLIFMMLLSTDSGIVTINNNRMLARIAWVFIIVCFVYFILKHSKFNKNALFFPLLFSVCTLLTMIVSEGVFNINYIQRSVLLFTACFIVNEFTYTEFMEAFVKLIRFVSIVSVIGVLLHDVICSIGVFPKFYAGEFAYEFLLFTNIPHYSTRNYGPVWEPGAFQIYVNLALLYLVRNNSSINLLDIVLFSITIITTKSTTGIVLLVLILAYFIFLKKYKRKNNVAFKVKFPILFLGIVGMIALFSSDTFYNIVFGKIIAFFENNESMNSANVSAYVRFKGIYANIELFLKKPLLGWGIDGMVKMLDEGYGFNANTCTILAVASTYGIIPFIQYNYLWVKSMFCQKSRLDGIIVGIFFLVVLSTENLLVSFLFWTLLIYESDILNKNSRFVIAKEGK